MGYGPRGGGDWPDESGEHVRPVRRQGPGGRRPPRRDATDPRGYQVREPDHGRAQEWGAQDYGRQDYGRDDWGYGGGGYGGGRQDRGGILPQWLPLWPTVLAASIAVIFAFVLGRVTGGGGDSGSDNQAKVVVETTTTISLTPSTHIVARNETLAAIASKYGVTIDELAIANNLGNVNHVFVGQNLKIPPPSAAATTTTTKKKSNK